MAQKPKSIEEVPQAKIVAEVPRLVTLINGSETIQAHPTQVALWLSQGWQIGEE